MSHEITLKQAMECAYQAEVVARLLQSYPHSLDDGDVSAIDGLLADLAGNAYCWLSEELAERENKQ